MAKKQRLEWCDRCLLISPYHYALCLSEDEFERELRRLNIPKEHHPHYLRTDTAQATCHFFEGPRHGRCAIVCLTNKRDQYSVEQVYGLLVHEAVHIWQEIREHLGERYPASEQEAYAIQQIAQNLMESYKRQVDG